MERLVVAAVLVAVAVVVALLLERRRSSVPTQPRKWAVPTQLDRADFEFLDVPWLVVVFTSESCESCAKVIPKATVLASEDVAVMEVPYSSRRDLHERYAIDVVPTTLVADDEGVVRAMFVGVPTATDLWAAVAEARDPGSTPEPELGRPTT